ncbi:hypothetical protein I3842_04G038200 [Carya illinoinensis]|uniref:Uncharacterized protein n=1 Tax=Carya illinoinensis TaxID=32201 RepID=A0A922F953_CARIL|nr:hypothetical protein I3842_04G038200 [Carya illinoinensis]
MDNVRQFLVESKTFAFSKVGANCFRILEKSRRMAIYLLINGAAASWVVKMVVEATETRWRENFFRKMRVGNGFLMLHLLRNARGCYLHLEEFINGRKRGSLIIPEGVKSCGWEGFAYNLKKVAEREAPRWFGELGFRPSTTPPVSYATVLSSAVAECSSTMEMMGDKPGFCPVDSKGISDSDTKLGEIEGVFWDVKAKLTGVLQEIATLMNKVDMRLGMVMGRDKGFTSASLQSIPEDRFPNMGWKDSASAEKRESSRALITTRPLEPLTYSGLKPQSPLKVINPQPPLTRASSPWSRASSQADPPIRVEPETW